MMAIKVNAYKVAMDRIVVCHCRHLGKWVHLGSSVSS